MAALWVEGCDYHAIEAAGGAEWFAVRLGRAIVVPLRSRGVGRDRRCGSLPRPLEARAVKDGVRPTWNAWELDHKARRDGSRIQEFCIHEHAGRGVGAGQNRRYLLRDEAVGEWAPVLIVPFERERDGLRGIQRSIVEHIRD